MATVHLFNPENDLALGLDCYCYTPRPNVAALHQSGAGLPWLWAADYDYVIPDNINWALIDRLDPWGWSKDAKRQFRLAGCPEHLLPSDKVLSRYRELSHRMTSIKLLRELESSFPLPLMTADVQEAINFVKSHPRSYLKSPWSGSGKGVIATSSLTLPTCHNLIRGIIHRQGSVMIEQEWDKQQDFATLWFMTPKGIRFHGYSVFGTANEGYYTGNYVAPQERLKEIIGQPVNIDALGSALETVLNGYEGPLGVDMMVCCDKRIMPCIEVNLRRTMGFIAMSLAAGASSDRVSKEFLLSLGFRWI